MSAAQGEGGSWESGHGLHEFDYVNQFQMRTTREGVKKSKFFVYIISGSSQRSIEESVRPATDNNSCWLLSRRSLVVVVPFRTEVAQKPATTFDCANVTEGGEVHSVGEHAEMWLISRSRFSG